MKTLKRTFNCAVVFAIAALWMMCMTASASSGDNSLYSLGLENATSCSPEFVYSTWEYNVTVPAGTTELLLSPVTSDSSASVVDISGTQLGEDGTTTCYITIEAANGARVSYTLYVSTDAAAETEAPETEAPETEKSAEQQASEEAARQSEQAASEAAHEQQIQYEQMQNQVTTLTKENEDLTDRMNLLMKIMYGLVGFAVLLLFFIINQSLRNRDLKEDLKEARELSEDNNEFARKEQNMQQTYYYNPQQNMPRGMAPERTYAAQPMTDVSASVQETFGNASQVLQAQPMPGQASAPAQKPETAPVNAAPQPEMTQASAAPQPMGPAANATQAPAEPVMVRPQTEEPDVNVEMIDL